MIGLRDLVARCYVIPWAQAKGGGLGAARVLLVAERLFLGRVDFSLVETDQKGALRFAGKPLRGGLLRLFAFARCAGASS